jgi:hypothetical protein
MSTPAASFAVEVRPVDRLDVLFDEIAELSGQRNAIDGRLVEIFAEIERNGLRGMTGAKSVAALVAWKTGTSLRNAHTVAAIADRLEEFPRCTQLLRDGRVSLDQVGVIAEKAGPGSDEHYATLVECATVSQLRTAIKLEPRPKPEPDPKPEPAPSYSKNTDEKGTCYRIWLPHLEAAKLDAAVASHLDRMVADWKHDHPDGGASDQAGAADAEHGRCVHECGRGRLGCRGGAAPARAAHHGGGASRRQGTGGVVASGSAADRRRSPLPAV